MGAVAANTSLTVKPRRWLRFSLRSGLIFVTALCLLIAFKAKQFNDRGASVAAIDAVSSASKTLIEGPEWLRELIGHEEAFHNVGSVRFGPINANYDASLNFDDELGNIIPHLNNFSHFHKLNIRSSPVSDVGLAYITRITNLEILNISDTEVTDSGLEILENIKSLKRLNIRNTEVTQKGIAKFQQASPGLQN